MESVEKIQDSQRSDRVSGASSKVIQTEPDYNRLSAAPNSRIRPGPEIRHWTISRRRSTLFSSSSLQQRIPSLTTFHKGYPRL